MCGRLDAEVDSEGGLDGAIGFVHGNSRELSLLFFCCALSSEVKIQNARLRACAFAGWGGRISVRQRVRLEQGRPFRIVEPRIPLPEKCQCIWRPIDDVPFSFNIPVPGILTNICQVVA